MLFDLLFALPFVLAFIGLAMFLAGIILPRNSPGWARPVLMIGGLALLGPLIGFVLYIDSQF